MTNRITRLIVPLLLVLFLGGLYLYTLAPGLTWAFDGADGGDLITAAATGGVPHPSGYPTYLILASLFLKIPFGSLAFRTNLFSLVCTVFAAFVVYQIVLAENGNISSALIAGLSFGVFPLIWSQAIITEVNALNGLLVTLILFLVLRRNSPPIADFLVGAFLGLGIGNHVTTIFMLPLLFGDLLTLGKFTAEENRWILKTHLFSQSSRIIRKLAGLCLGLCVYLVIPFRARSGAPVNWGNATTWNQFVWLVTGQMYRTRLLDWSAVYLYKGVQVWSRFLLDQLGVTGILLIFIAVALLFKPTRLFMAAGWMVIIYSAFSILYYSPDSYVYLIPALVAFSIWIGLSSAWISDQVSKRFPRFKTITMLCIGAIIILRALWAIPVMNLSSNKDAEQYAQTILKSAPSQAIIFTTGDEATFSLWYFHYAYRRRPDIAIICTDLLDQPWYDQVINYTYPNLIVADYAQEQDIIHDNPGRPICWTELNLKASVICSP
jgi:hypothetical protein